MDLKPNISLREQLARLSPREMEAMLRRLPATGTSSVVDRDVHGDTFPATYAQILFWRQYAADRGASQNHQLMAFRIRGPLDIEALKTSFRMLSDGQPSLRTVFFEDERDVWQQIRPSLPIPFELIDPVETAEPDDFLKRPFQLESEPPIRVRVVRESEDIHLLEIVKHHISSDARSKVVMLQQVSGYYNLCKQGHAAATGLHGSYMGRKALAEREWLSGRGAEGATRYWKEADFSDGMGHRWPEGRHWASDMDTAADVSGRLDFDLGDDLSQRVRSFASGRGMTPLQLLMGCYFLCLQRLVPGSVVTIGMPVDMRSREYADTVGCFMNAVPVTMDAVPPKTIDAYLDRVVERMKNAIEHARMPLYRILELGFEADPSAKNLSWRTIFHVKEDWFDALQLADVSVEALPVKPVGSVADIGLTILRANEGQGRSNIQLRAEIDTSKISMADATAIMETWRHVISQCVIGQAGSIDAIDILLPGERERLRALSGRDSRVVYPETTLHAIFRQTAERYPQRPAVIAADGTEMSYADLQVQMSRVSSFLRSRGIQKDSIVALHMHRSPSLLASMLGILEAGGAFLLLEPSLPLERLRTMAEQARVKAVIAGQGIEELPGFEGCTYPLPDILSSEPAGGWEEGVGSGPDTLAYVMFTSGSTGVPKGAMIEHGNVINWLYAAVHAMGFAMDDRTLYKYPLSWDVGLTDLLMPMCTGGAVVMAEPGSEVDVQQIADLALRHRVTYLHFAPGVLRAFLQVPDVRKVNGLLRIIHCGGESLPEPLMRTCLQTLEATLYHRYGPTETTMSATHWICNLTSGHERPPIGRPNANVDLLIMDPKGRPVPPGMSGELWIGGTQTGRGYINNDEETRKRFVGDPLEPGSGRRYYRTGDMARFLSDGNLLFLGRMDDQLKVRGVRVELGDVSAALHRCKGVRAAVVLPEPDGMGSNRLRSWVTLKEGVWENESTIRASLLERLPGYMIPFRIHVIDTIPLTPHGKTDHRALRTLAEQDAADMDAGLPLENDTQRRLAALWSQLLGVEVQHRDADFFRLGGHSLIAMRLSGRIHAEFGLSIPLPELFSDARLDRLAAWIDEARGKPVAEAIVRSHADPGAPLPARCPQPMHEGADIVYPASLIQELFWRYERGNPHAPRNPEGVMFRLHGRVDVEALKSAILLLSTSQPALRTIFFERNGEVYQRVKPHLPIPLECVDSMEPVSESSPGLQAFMTIPFDLENGPLLRFRLVSHGDDTHILQVARHHIIFDAVSMVQLFRELSEYYNALIAGAQPVPKARRLSLGDLAMEQREWMVSEEASKSLDYWMERQDLRGMEHGWPGPAPDQTVSGKGRSVSFETELDRALSSRIHACLGQRGTTLFRFLMGTYFLTLQGLLPGRAVTVGVPVSLRRTKEENELIGCLISTLPVTLEPIRSGTAWDRIKLAGRRLDEGMRHDRMNWQHIVERWKLQRGVSRNIAPKTVMNFRERSWEMLDIKGLSVEQMPVRRLQQSMDMDISLDSNSNLGRLGNIRICGGYDDVRLTGTQVEYLMDVWVSVIRHCMDEEDPGAAVTEASKIRVYAFAGGAGGFDEHAKFHRMGESLGEGLHLQVLPDPEASFGLLPGMGLPELAKGYAERIMKAGSKGKVWLLGEGLGAVDAFATACALQRLGVADVGLILLDPLVPNAAEKVHDHRSAAMEAYDRMPERGSPLQEWLFDIRLQAATRGPLRSWSHPVPKSKHQVFKASQAYGLFDAELYRDRYGDEGLATSKELWLHYLSDGWRSRRHPSERFHAYRYDGLVEGFALGSDEPVLHALLFGMRKVETRRRMLEGLERPLDRQEILSARERLRMEAIGPERLCGKAHLVMTGKGPGTNAQDQWQAWVDGQVQSHHADAGLVDRLESIALIIQGFI
jgi:amino acid adenylation domain-containing protein